MLAHLVTVTFAYCEIAFIHISFSIFLLHFLFYLNHNDTSFSKTKRIHTLVFTTLLKSSFNKDTLLVIKYPLRHRRGRHTTVLQTIQGNRMLRAVHPGYTWTTCTVVAGEEQSCAPSRPEQSAMRPGRDTWVILLASGCYSVVKPLLWTRSTALIPSSSTSSRMFSTVLVVVVVLVVAGRRCS